MDYDIDSHVRLLIDNYKDEIKAFKRMRFKEYQRELVILFGAYTDVIKEVIFRSKKLDRKMALKEYSEKDWKESRRKYIQILREMFNEANKYVEEL